MTLQEDKAEFGNCGTGERIKQELAYQAERAAQIGDINSTPRYIIERYRKSKLWWVFYKEYMFKQIGDLNEKEVLDFGCGEGELSTQLAKLGARVTGIDISPELIQIAKKRAHMDGVLDRTDFIVGEITQSPLAKNRFDIIVCYAVLHHVDIHSVLPLVIASLKKGGMAIIIEPLALSPILRRVRDLVPVGTDASPGEHPLDKEDLDLIIGSLSSCRIRFFDLFGRFQILFPNRNRIDKGHSFTKAALVFLGTLDYVLLSVFPFLSRFCGEAVIVGRKP